MIEASIESSVGIMRLKERISTLVAYVEELKERITVLEKQVKDLSK